MINLQVSVAHNVMSMMYHYRFGHSFLSVDIVSMKKNGANIHSSNVLDFIPYCSVCVLGALYLSVACVMNDKNMTSKVIHGWVSFSSIMEDLSKVFSSDQVDLIEGMYEGTLDENSVFDFYRSNHRLVGEKERMKLIMTNIINNNGIFKP